MNEDGEVSLVWKRKVANDTLSRLNETRLSKSICGQLKDRLKSSHDTFHVALDRLEAFHQQR